MSDILTATATVVAAMVRNHTGMMDLPMMVEETYKMFKRLESPKVQTVFDDYLVCMVDGNKVKYLRSYVKHKHGFTDFNDYLVAYNLPKDHPTVARTASLRRSEIAKKHGLGVKKHGSA